MSFVLDEEIQVLGVEFLIFFEFSLVIGGDYFDIVCFKEDQECFVVVIVDVVGYGLLVGLCMVMFKVVVQVFVLECKEFEGILQVFDEIVCFGLN